VKPSSYGQEAAEQEAVGSVVFSPWLVRRSEIEPRSWCEIACVFAIVPRSVSYSSSLFIREARDNLSCSGSEALTSWR
jgi:hypothetical protein